VVKERTARRVVGRTSKAVRNLGRDLNRERDERRQNNDKGEQVTHAGKGLDVFRRTCRYICEGSFICC
jgi:hypothetical protein